MLQLVERPVVVFLPQRHEKRGQHPSHRAMHPERSTAPHSSTARMATSNSARILRRLSRKSRPNITAAAAIAATRSPSV